MNEEAQLARMRLRQCVESARKRLNEALIEAASDLALSDDTEGFALEISHELRHIADLCPALEAVVMANSCHLNHQKHEAMVFVPVSATGNKLS